MVNRETSTVANNDAGGGGGGRGMREYTRVSSHVSRGAGVHEPVTAAGVSGRRGRLLESGVERRVIEGRCSRWSRAKQAAVAGRGRNTVSGLRCSVEGLMSRGRGWRSPGAGARGTGMV